MIAVYAVIHALSHHHGTAFIAFLTALWIAWPTAEEQRRFTAKQTWATWGMAVLLGCLCVVNISDSAVAIRHEYLYPYSGGEDAARYLKSVGADHTTVFGVDYGVVAIQPYFDHNIFANTSSAYFHHGWPPAASSVPADLLERVKPEYIVVFTHEPTEYLQLNAVPMANDRLSGCPLFAVGVLFVQAGGL